MVCNNHILIGNYGPLDPEDLEAAALHPFHVFFQNVKAVTDRLNLQITDIFEYSVVVQGNEEDTETLRKYFGENYPPICLNDENYQLVQTFENKGNAFPKNSLPDMKSEIIISPMPPIHYNA